MKNISDQKEINNPHFFFDFLNILVPPPPPPLKGSEKTQQLFSLQSNFEWSVRSGLLADVRAGVIRE